MSWWEGGTLNSLKLNYMQKCVNMFNMCTFLKREFIVVIRFQKRSVTQKG